MKTKQLIPVVLTLLAAALAGSSDETRRFVHYMEASSCSCNFSTWERVVFSLILVKADAPRRG